jgi:putative ABC transport system permease protein
MTGRIAMAARLATRDFGHDWRIALCQVLGLAAVLAPLLVLFGLRFGLIDTLAQRLIEDPRNREIVPAGSGRFDDAFFTGLAARPDVAFVTPATRAIAAGVTRLRSEAGGRTLSGTPMLPTGRGDPMLGAAELPSGSSVVLTRRLAESLDVGEGGRLVAEITRQRDGVLEAQRIPLTVSGITDQPVSPGEAILAPLDLLVATEDWRDGFAVDDRGWPGGPRPQAERNFARFRLYARSIYDVAGLEEAFRRQDIAVRTAAADIAQMQSLDRNLGIAFWLIAGCGGFGYLISLAAGLRSHVERKRRDLALLRLIGLPTRALVAFPVTQAVLIALLGLVLGAAVFQGAATVLNTTFATGLLPGERICRLLPVHFGVAAAATMAAALLSASWGGLLAARIEVSKELRDG